jgi:hypothetical protein
MQKESHFDEEESRLKEEISQAVQEYAKEIEVKKIKSLARYNPGKVAKILYLFSLGNSQTRIVRKYGVHRNTVVHVLTEFADHLGKFKELGGKLAARSYMNLSSLEEDLIDKVRERMETDPEMQVGFKDIKELSIAKSNAAREALTARGEASNISEERKVYTQEDYEKTIEAAKKRIAEAKQVKDAQIIDMEE